MSLLRTIRPLEQATIRSRVGRISQPFTTAAFTVLVRAGAGSRPYRRRHALGESDCSLHIARSYDKTRCPWFLSPSNKALATAPFPSGMVGRFPEAPVSCLSNYSKTLSSPGFYVGARQLVRQDGGSGGPFYGAQPLQPTQHAHQLASAYSILLATCAAGGYDWEPTAFVSCIARTLTPSPITSRSAGTKRLP